MKKSFALIVGLAFLAMFAATASHAATVFSDNFNSENGGAGMLNYYGFTQWTISSYDGSAGGGAIPGNYGAGSVDLIGQNTAWNYFPTQGLYVDLDGSTNNAGVMNTNQSFAAGHYQIQFDLGGSQRGDTNVVDISMGDWSAQLTRGSSDLLATVTFDVTTTQAGQLIFHNQGPSEGVYGDNVGAILDNVKVSAVPVPPSVLLLAPGLLGLVGMRKRFHI